jgi:hypothetical protein
MIAPRTAPLPHAQAFVPPHLSTVVLTGAGFSVDAGLPVTDVSCLLGSARSRRLPATARPAWPAVA